MIIKYKDIEKLDNLVLDKMTLVLSDLFIPVISWIDQLVSEYSENNPNEHLYMLNLELDNDILSIELIHYEDNWYFIDFEKNPSVDEKLDIINFGKSESDKTILSNLKFNNKIGQSKCKVSVNLIKDKYIKYGI